MKIKLTFIFLINFFLLFGQEEKDSLLKKDINSLVQEMEFMYEYDQLMREYIFYKSLNKCFTDSIENLPDSSRFSYLSKQVFYNDSLGNNIWKNAK